jgi:hypothetical protein
MQRLPSLALDKVRSAGIIAKDAIMHVPVDMLQTGKRFSCINNLITSAR